MMFWGVPGGFDSSYMIYLAIALIVPMLAQMKLKSTFASFKQVRSFSGMTGAQVARRILDGNGLHQVPVVEIGGHLSDHYDPRQRVIRLSGDIYRGQSLASAAVAAHEVGHAIQHEEGYAFLNFRSALFPVVNITSRLGIYAVFIGLMMEGLMGLAMLGVIMVGFTVLFQLVTLPVEFNASSRAMVQLERFGVLRGGDEEAGAKKVLSAAAWTYVAGTVVAVAELVRLIFVLNNRNSRRR
ncbi:MAG: zinc metallopeptidase [Turicibacter sp.]|nr:zinc metallopeptidase [Turicibacter sp.]